MLKTIVSYGRDMYHTACLSEEEAKDARIVPPEDLEQDDVCNECMETLVGEETPDDDEAEATEAP